MYAVLIASCAEADAICMQQVDNVISLEHHTCQRTFCQHACRMHAAGAQVLSAQRRGIVFLLWGKFAQDRAAVIDTSKHHILKSAHPSGLSANRGECRLGSARAKCKVSRAHKGMQSPRQ